MWRSTIEKELNIAETKISQNSQNISVTRDHVNSIDHTTSDNKQSIKDLKQSIMKLSSEQAVMKQRMCNLVDTVNTQNTATSSPSADFQITHEEIQIKVNHLQEQINSNKER